MKRLSLTVSGADAGERLDRFVARAGAISRGLARRAIEAGGVYVDGRRLKIASRPVQPGQSIAVVLEESGRAAGDRLAPEQPPSDLEILYEDADLLAVAKPAFVPAQATLAGDRGALTDLIADHLKLRSHRETGLVHRLDRETSGVTLFGKTRAATAGLSQAFREGRVRKRYLAIACGPLPPEGTIDRWLAKDPARPGCFLAVEPGRGVPALTCFRALSVPGEATAVALFPKTGRTHQIRVHLRALGAPILGDLRYGAPRRIAVRGMTLDARRVLLHAAEIALTHPSTGAPLAVHAPLPDDLRAVLEALDATLDGN